MYNITRGNSADFVVEALSSAGGLIIPSSLTLTVTYKVSGVPTVDTVTMTVSNSFWTGSWDSSPADLGIATVTITYPGLSGVARTETLNVIDP